MRTIDMQSTGVLTLLLFASEFASSASFTFPARARPVLNDSPRDSHYSKGIRLFLFDSNIKNNYGMDSGKNSRDGDFDVDTLRWRLDEMRIRGLEVGFKRPPNPNLSATEFIMSCLECLWTNNDPLPDSGFRLLLRASTKTWRSQIYQSVGVPLSAHEEMVASALGEAIARPNNQFGILVREGEEYKVTFPMDPLDYADGTCWVECQLRSAHDSKLLVTTGWQLQKENGAWLVDNIDWQDFRDTFRPGIGREEWMRICG